MAQRRCQSCDALVETDVFGHGQCAYCHAEYNDPEISIAAGIAHKLTDAQTLLQLHSWARAEEAFASLTQEAPAVHRAWWGLVCARSQLFTRQEISKTALEELRLSAESAIKMAPGDTKREYTQTWQEYYDRTLTVLEEKTRVLTAQIEELEVLNKPGLRFGCAYCILIVVILVFVFCKMYYWVFGCTILLTVVSIIGSVVEVRQRKANPHIPQKIHTELAAAKKKLQELQ